MDSKPVCNPEDLVNESDVEQKFILPLLISPTPYGLEFTNSDFRTKPDIRRILIDKGSSEKLYYPDYVIIFSGLPVLIIEAKAPGEDLVEALRQARLYANELNTRFPRKINPCQKILVSDGITTICAFIDTDDGRFELSLSDISVTNPRYNQLLDFARREVLLKEATTIKNNIRGGARFIKPKHLLGGRSIQNTELRENSFGATLSFEFRNIFNPESKGERKDIVENAYVTTKRILHHIQPIEKIIRKSKTFGVEDIQTISDTETPAEIIEKFKSGEKLRNELILLIGNVGAGKSTFVDYLKEKALPNEIKTSTLWITINLNTAPLNKDEIYKWIKQQIVEKLIQQHPEYDFLEKDVLIKVYGLEFKALRKGPASFFQPGSNEYNMLFANKLLELEADPDSRSKAFVRFLCSSRAKLLTIVLDNCDKRNAEEQLLMFDVATWLKEYYECLVFLPLRETTFTLFRKQKPLDTVIKDLVFKIDPPLLREVIIARLRYTLRTLGKGKTTLFYELPNGMKVEYPQSEQGLYLASIVRSLFENTYFNRLISGIAGKDIRKGLEVFLDFCKSGHIDEAEILKMKKFGAQYVLKNHVVSKIILRGNRKYYGEDSIIKNLFASYPDEDILPNPFTRFFILKWLNNNYYVEGPSRAKGFHMASQLMRDLATFGHDKTRILAELNTLIKYGLIVTESQTEFLENENDLIAITSYGMIHLDLITDINFLSAISEDVYYREPQIATDIYKRISGKIGYGQYSFETIVENSLELIQYLESYAAGFINEQASSDFTSVSMSELYKFEKEKVRLTEYSQGKEYFETKRLVAENPVGSFVECEIVAIREYGIFVEFGLECSGLVHISQFEKLGKVISDYELGDYIITEVLFYNEQHHRFSLKYIKDKEVE